MSWVNERVEARYQKVGVVYAVDAFPVNVAGKTLRRVLREEYLAG
jgi:acyl-coenzyme A synthetase/AMP-(fatty) acid ligase